MSKDIIKITSPLNDETIEKLRAGDQVLISGIVYTARDSAHKRLVESMKRNEIPPFDLKGSIIYYVGPAPTKPGYVIGPAGPTTSGRMDAYSPFLLENGLKGMIGKGTRSKEVIEAMKKFKAVYFASIGGAAALTAKQIVGNELVAYEDLGPEAIRKLTVKDFYAVVINDIYGNDYYKIGTEKYKR